MYQTPVRAEILPTGGLASHKPDYAAERAAFVIFDMSAPVPGRVVPGRPFKTATLRPERAGIATRVDGDAVEFTLDRPQKMALLLDNDTGWNMLGFDGARHVRVEGITLRNAANWNFTIGKSEDIEVRDVRIISGCRRFTRIAEVRCVTRQTATLARLPLIESLKRLYT